MAEGTGSVADPGSQALGPSRRTIMGYVKQVELPLLVTVACRALAHDKQLLVAHYVPAQKVNRPTA
jgi:hypothetical protein